VLVVGKNAEAEEKPARLERALVRPLMTPLNYS
jgi:hypothetical protein